MLCAITGTRNAILAEPATTAVHDNVTVVGIDVPILYRVEGGQLSARQSLQI